jgi:hypothetical protein
MRIMFCMSLLILFVVCITSEKIMKNKKKNSKSIMTSSFLQVGMKSPVRIFDDIAMDDRYERPNKRGRVQDDYMGAGLSDDEKFEEFKRSIQMKRLKK